MVKEVFRHFGEVKFQNPPSVIIGWKEDVGNLAPGVIDYLNKKLRSRYFCQITPGSFFPIEGVPVRENVIDFPESKFFAIEEKDLVIFKSNSPSRNWWKFLNALLDVAQHYCRVKELYTVNGIPSPTPHTQTRRVLTVANHPKFKKEIRDFGLLGMEFQGEPALNSFLLWLAKRRGIPGLSIWEDIPFYLVALDDLKAQKRILEFFDRKFNLGIDFRELDARIEEQNERIGQLRKENSEINKCLGMLEMGISLSGEEGVKLIQEVEKALEKRG